MKIILFRAWDKDNKTMSDPFDVFHGDNYMWNDVVLLQFTGLKDKNGIDIYEGDVVRITNTYYGDYDVEVEFIDGAFGYQELKARQVKNPKGWDKEHDSVESNGFNITGNKAFWEQVRFKDKKDPQQYEVIGNIYENPELIK